MAAAWEEAKLAPPTITIINPKNLHAHLIYELTDPVYSGAENQKPYRYLKAVYSGMRQCLSADMAYTQFLTKSPFCGKWTTYTHDVTYELSLLSQGINLNSVPASNDEYIEGRNHNLFNKLRRWGYTQAHRCKTEDQLHSLLLDVAHGINDEFDTPLSEREVNSVVKSVSKWTWRERDNLGCKKPVINLPLGISKHDAQRAGAHYSSALKKQKTQERIGQAIKSIQVDGGKLTLAEISRRTGIHRNTLSRYHSAWIEAVA